MPIPAKANSVLPRPTIEAFDAWLAVRSLCLDAIVVGDSALALDANPMWPDHARATLEDLRAWLGHGV